MARELSDVAHVNLRIREDLRQRIETAAKEHQTSINNEMRLRLESSFEAQDRRALSGIAHDMSVAWARLSGMLHQSNLLGDTLRELHELTAAIDQLPDELRGHAAMRPVLERVERAKVIGKMVDKEAARLARAMHTV